MPAILKELMRHESVETTMKYYVQSEAESTAAILWESHRKMSANAITAEAEVEKTSKEKWSGAGSNRRHADFQSTALPTELPDRPAAKEKPLSEAQKCKPQVPTCQFVSI